MVQQTPRGSDQQLRISAQVGDLVAHRRSARDHPSEGPGVAGQLHELVQHLARQLPGRHQHQGPSPALGPGLVEEALEHRQQKGRGLAGTGGGRNQQIPALQGRRNHLLLNRSGLGEAQLIDGAQ